MKILDNRYELKQSLGAGAYGEVYQAFDKRLSRVVALKLIKAELLNDDEALARFDQEACLAANLDHPHITMVFDIGEERGQKYLTMRYADGRSLAEELKLRGKLQVAEVRRYAEQIAQALDYAHERGVVHRDIKPHNLVTDKQRGVLLTDFGIARALEKRLTQKTGMRLGTLPYLAPEIWSKSAYSAASDQYALACVLYELLSGKPLHHGESDAEIMYSILMKPVQIQRAEIGGLEVAGLLKGLEREASARHVNCSELVKSLFFEETLLEKGQNVPFQAGSAADEPAQAIERSKTALDTLRRQLAEVQTARQARENEIKAEQSARAKRAAAELAQLKVKQELEDQLEAERQKLAELNMSPEKRLGLEWVEVPAGEFRMGRDKGDADEKPEHKVWLDRYWIGKSPVTNAQFSQFVKATGYRTSAERMGAEYTWRSPRGAGSGLKGKERHPVVVVSWEDAVAYCEWVSGQVGYKVELPSEAQWEKAARGVDGRKYAWGGAAPSASRCNFGKNVGDTTAVGSYSPAGDSPYGCVDMSGNVWEWCADWYADDYYENSPARNPQGPSSGDTRVLRGGSWDVNSDVVRVSYRDGDDPSYSASDLGFRCSAFSAPR